MSTIERSRIVVHVSRIGHTLTLWFFFGSEDGVITHPAVPWDYQPSTSETRHGCSNVQVYCSFFSLKKLDTLKIIPENRAAGAQIVDYVLKDFLLSKKTELKHPQKRDISRYTHGYELPSFVSTEVQLHYLFCKQL